MTYEISNHCISARHAATQSPNELNAIRNALNSPGIRGVCLYFHGGLSGAEYVTGELGKELMDTFYLKSNLYTAATETAAHSGLYPIFVIYDADIRDRDTLKEWAISIVSDIRLDGPRERLKKWVEKKNNFNKSSVTDDREFWMHELFEDSANKSSNDDLDLRASKLISEDSRELHEIAEKWAQNDPELSDIHLDSELKSDKGFGLYHLAKIAVRLAARFALRTNHEIVPTIVEECLREIPVLNDLAPAHWRTVYKHAQECWQPGRNGHALFTLLAEIKKSNSNFIINAQSHSAGSITIGELIDASSQNNWPKLDSVVLVAPALNQQFYADKYIKNLHQYERQTVFVLSEQDEKKDTLVKFLYPASLLYFVSGAAETTGFGNKMLLIEEHLQSNKHPYSKEWYRKTMQDMEKDPIAAIQVWGARNNSIPKIKFKTCPDIESTHSSTKVPKNALARDLLAALKV